MPTFFKIGQYSLWIKITIALTLCCLLLLLETYLFTSVPHTTKYKIYRFQFSIVLNLVFFYSSKFLWRRLVTDVVNDFTITFVQVSWKLIVLSFLLLAHFSPFTNYMITKEPSSFNMLSWSCFAAYIVLFTVLWAIKLLFDFLQQLHKSPWFSVGLHVQSIVAVVFTFTITCIAYGIANSPPKIISVEIPVAKLPPSMDNLRIALICDVHLGPTVGFSKLDRVVKMTNDLKPDVVVFAGDLMDVTVDDSQESGLPLKDLNAPLGKFYVTGNHEYYTGDVDNWFNLVEEYGFVVLHNANKKVRSPRNHDEWLCMIGTDDIQANQIRYNDHGMDLEKAYAGCDSSHASILIAHQPKAAQMAIDAGYDIQLILSGHTHGGQMYPFRWFAYLANPFLNGLYQYKGAYVYVSQGSVYYGFPLRLGTHSEITNITLKAGV